MVLDAREQEDRTIDGRQVHPPPVDDEHAASQFVVDEQVLDDPEVEGSGQILRPFEPVGEVDVPSDVVGIVDVGEKTRQALEREREVLPWWTQTNTGTPAALGTGCSSRPPEVPVHVRWVYFSRSRAALV